MKIKNNALRAIYLSLWVISVFMLVFPLFSEPLNKNFTGSRAPRRGVPIKVFQKSPLIGCPRRGPAGGIADQAGKEKGFQWKIDDLLTTERVEEYQLSPDGQWLAWTVTRWDLEKQTQYQTLYLTSLKEREKGNKKTEDIQLTRGSDTYSALQWVPGGEAVSFKTNRKFKETKPGNLWVMPLHGGEPYPVTACREGIEGYAWIDKKNIIFIAREADNLWETEAKKQQDTSEVIEDEDHQVIKRLFKYNLETQETIRLTTNRKPMIDFSLSENKKQVIYSVSMSLLFEQDNKIPPRYYLLDLETKNSREILEKFPHLPEGRFYWEKEGESVFFTASYTTHPLYYHSVVSRLFRFNLKTYTYEEVPLGWDRYFLAYGNVLQLTPGGFLIQLIDGVHFKYARYNREGNQWKRDWITGGGQENIKAFEFSQDGRVMVYEHSTASQPQRYYMARLKSSRLVRGPEVMDLQSPLFKRPLGKTEIRTWKGAKGETIEGILYYPVEYQAGRKYPLMLMIHGGPSYADMDSFDDDYFYPAHLWCERGTFVLKPNYHGSTNYGVEFGESLAGGHYYDLEIPDIEAGVDVLIEEGKVDGERLGIIGHSNGALLGAALTGHTTRYRAVSLTAGDVNWTSDYGNCSFGVSFDSYYLGGAPWEKTDLYIQKSLLFRMQKVTTPTLIFHGDKDRACPYSQGWEHYRALQVIGKAPVRFISFPGEGHVPQKLSHQRRKLKEEIAWLEKYLFETYKTKNESLKKNSPLDRLEKMQTIAKHEGNYGIFKNGMLIPEVVEYEKIQVGRYEVTRAQWAAFDKGYSYEPGTGNYPVTGISFEKAGEYVRWLSAQTGGTYRLPTEEEAGKFYKKPSGNTFDYWAGYELNPEDYGNLVEEMKKFGDRPVLLKPVGSFEPEGESGEKGEGWIFDLGGNAAEWVVLKNSKGKASGGFALGPVDTRGEMVVGGNHSPIKCFGLSLGALIGAPGLPVISSDTTKSEMTVPVQYIGIRVVHE